jgi:hypothetical protein
MTHWMDDLAKGFEKGSMSRRNVFRVALKGLAVAAGVSLSKQMEVVGLAFGQPVRESKCIRELTRDKKLRLQVSLDREGINFDRQSTYDQVSRVATSEVTIRRERTPLFRADVRATKGGAASVTINYFSGFTGVRNVALKTEDGKTFEGVTDGRAFTMTKSGSTFNVKFSDGHPQPQITGDPKIADVIKALGKESNEAFKTCRQAVFTQQRIMRGGGGSNWYLPGGTYNSPNCDNCFENCGKTAEDICGLEDWENLFNWIRLATALACYPIVTEACWGTCQLPGGGCCPEPCGDVGDCCGRHDTCFEAAGSGAKLCCPASMVVCQNACCGPFVKTCAPDGSCGCQEGQLGCGGNCCPDSINYKCCGGDCCPKNAECLNNSCCEFPSHACAGICCPPFQPCCNNVCCSGNVRCVNGTCCPVERACDQVCCPEGQTCRNGTCISGINCREMVGVEAGRLIACTSMNLSTRQFVDICCARGIHCCNGQCCPGPGLECCADGVCRTTCVR